MVIIISVLVTALCVFFAVFLSSREKLPAKPKAVNYLKASINYGVSFMTVIDNINFAVLNISITNNHDYILENISISSYPALPFIDEIIIKEQEKTNNAKESQTVYASICRKPLSVAALSVSSGYLIVASPDSTCPLNEIKITVNDMTVTIPVNKGFIKKETIASKQF